MPLNWDDPGLNWDASSQTWPDYPTAAPIKDQRAVRDLRVALHRAGRDPVDLSTRWDSLRWSTNAVGGYGSATLSLPGLDWLRLRAHTGLLRVSYGPRILFEGEVEDVGPTLNAGGMATTLEAFGLARRLDNTLRRIWIKRDIPWKTLSTLTGTAGGLAISYDPQTWNSVTIGNFDDTDLSRHGVQVLATSGIICAQGAAGGVRWFPAQLPISTLLCSVVCSQVKGDIVNYAARDSVDGITWNQLASGRTLTPLALTIPLTANSAGIQLLAYYPSGNTNAHADVRYENIRVLGAIPAEDAAGGFYGGTILRDLISLVPDLTLGTVEDGTDFLITQLERSIRNTYRGVVDEVAGYYQREWAVWESGRFDWRTPPLDEPQWYVQLGDLAALDLRHSVDGLHKDTYVLFTDAASGLDSEAQVTSADQRNPYVRNGEPHDGLLSASFPMTPLTAGQLAARVNTDNGAYPDVTGKVTIPFGQTIRNASGETRPAYAIRAGDNIRVIGLPVSDWVTPGRDGQTFFHIASTDVDVGTGMIDLTLQGQAHRTDQLLARLAAATRLVTG